MPYDQLGKLDTLGVEVEVKEFRVLVV